MDSIEHDLEQGLAKEPLTRGGFSDELRRKIEQRIETESVQPRKRRYWLAGATAAVSFALLSALMMTRMAEAPNTAKLADSGQSNAAMTSYAGKPAPALTPTEVSPVQSALLIGLRTDHPASAGTGGYSSYRTVLVAPENGQPKLTAEGNGILMPYLQSFWRIEPVTFQRDGTFYQVLTASPATPDIPPSRSETKPETAVLAGEQKLLFAGNRYLAVADLTKDRQNAASSLLWVKELKQMPDGKMLTAWNPAAEPHVAQEEILGSKASFADKATKTDNWTIVRQPGRWVGMSSAKPAAPPAKAPSAKPSAAPSVNAPSLVEGPAVKLPESVVSHDEMTADWTEIRRLHPNASDAFSSPNGDMLAVVVDGSILIYPYREHAMAVAPLSIKLNANESIVMAQWATDGYVELWKRDVKAELMN